MTEEQYYEYLYQALASNKLVPDSNLWRNKLEYAVSFLEIDRSYINRINQEYGIQFSEVILINATKNILLCRSMKTPISKKLCVASVYFSLLGCLLDFWIDSGNVELRSKGIMKLSQDNYLNYFKNFEEEKNVKDIADELFIEVSKGMKFIFKSNPDLYNHLIDLVNNVAISERMVAEKNQSVEDKMIYNKSVLFVKIAILLAVGNKKDLEDKDIHMFEKIGLLYAYVDDLIDVYEDIHNKQGNIFVKKLYAGETYKTVIDSGIHQLKTLIDEIREYMGGELADFLLNEISDWIYTNPNLIRKKYESR